jgi:hypothetical protein
MSAPDTAPTRGDLMADPTAMLRIAGTAAVVGGLMRLATPFTGMLLGDQLLHLLWVLTDFLLLIGTVGLFLACRRRVGVPGMLSVAVAVFGLLLVRSSAEHIFGPASYDVGSAVWAIGQAALAALILVGQARSFAIACWLWIGALALGLAGAAIPGLPDLWLEASGWAGLLFAAAFVFTGVELLRNPASLPKLGAAA